MRKLLFTVLVLFFVGCKGQDKEPKTIKIDQDSVSVPRGSWDVRREYDAQGNVVKYDSIYSYSYWNIEGDSIQVNLVSLMGASKQSLKRSIPFQSQNGFSYFPNNDSLFMEDFFRDDYFYDQWERQPMDMKEMMRRMDSTRNIFMKRFHPGLMESQKED